MEQEATNQAVSEDRLSNAMQTFPRVQDVYEATSTVEGDSSTEIRQRIINYANNPTQEALQILPKAFQAYIHKVVEESHKVTDRDIKRLQDSGYSEDFVFEITVAASLGSGLRRFRAGIEALSHSGASSRHK